MQQPEVSVTVLSDLLGHTMKSVEWSDDEVIFTREDGRRFRFWHEQDCCESVLVDDVNGDMKNLVGAPLTIAEERSSDALEAAAGAGRDASESHTWTFYAFATRKGFVDVRWLGESNGYYSESVSFEEVK